MCIPISLLAAVGGSQIDCAHKLIRKRLKQIQSSGETMALYEPALACQNYQRSKSRLSHSTISSHFFATNMVLSSGSISFANTASTWVATSTFFSFFCN